MASVDLLFRQTPLPTTSPVDLLFGETESLPDIEGYASGALPALGGSIQAAHVRPVTVGGSLPALGGTITLSDRVAEPITVGGSLPALGGHLTATFDSDPFGDRPTVGQFGTSHQLAIKTETGAEERVQVHLPAPGGFQARHQVADHLRVGVEARQPRSLLRTRSGATPRHQDADPVKVLLGTSHAEMLRDRRPSRTTMHQEGIGVGTSTRTSHQDRYRDRRPSLRSRFEEALPLHWQRHTRHQEANPLVRGRKTRHQEAMVPPPGLPTVTPPEPHVCYTPSPDLLFYKPPGDSHLLFICDNDDLPPPDAVIVPIKKVYIVFNDVYLKRVADNLMLPATSLSLSIDADSWTWSFNAQLPASSLDDIMPVSSQPVELEASVNGNAYRVLVENISRDRTFGSRTISISGRGKSALLASPYAPTLTFANTEARTAQQLMADVLTFNGIPLGWDIDWQLEDWLVPPGAFSQQGSYMDALNSIVGAAGAYLQPHPTDQSLTALLRYPVAPWKWSTDAEPDFVIPSAVMTREGIEWVTKPDYNRVFVSGTGQGVLGQITRTGSAGDLVAPMVTDPLITEAVVARQRGIAVLGDTGRQAMVTLSLPVLEETGVIPPGKYVQYEDGSVVRLGLTRSTAVDFGKSGTQVRQTLVLETHE